MFNNDDWRWPSSSGNFFRRLFQLGKEIKYKMGGTSFMYIINSTYELSINKLKFNADN